MEAIFSGLTVPPGQEEQEKLAGMRPWMCEECVCGVCVVCVCVVCMCDVCAVCVGGVCVFVCVCSVSLFATPWPIARQALVSVGFSRQEYWSVGPRPPPGDLP